MILTKFLKDGLKVLSPLAVALFILSCVIPLAFSQTVSEEAQRHFSRGMAAVEMAKTEGDYEDAIREFEQAIRLAPNFTNAYYNLGMVQERVGKFDDAIKNFKRYIELNPQAQDASQVKDLIYKIEFRLEKIKKEREIVKAIQGHWGNTVGFHMAHAVIDFYAVDGKIEAGVYTRIASCMPSWAKSLRDVWFDIRRIPVQFDGKNMTFKYNVTLGNFYNRDRNCLSGSIDVSTVPLSFNLSLVSEGLLAGTVIWGKNPPTKAEFKKE